MIARFVMLFALASLAFGNAAMARDMPMTATIGCTTGAACCPDSGSAMPLSDCVTCCVMASVIRAIPVRAELKTVAPHSATSTILIPYDVRPLDPPPRPHAKPENSI